MEPQSRRKQWKYFQMLSLNFASSILVQIIIFIIDIGNNTLSYDKLVITNNHKIIDQK